MHWAYSIRRTSWAHDMARGVVLANRRVGPQYQHAHSSPAVACAPTCRLFHIDVMDRWPSFRRIKACNMLLCMHMHPLCDTFISSLCSEHTTHRFVPLLTLHRTHAAMGKGGYKDDGVLSHLYKVHLVAGLGLASGIHVPHADTRLRPRGSACSKNRGKRNAAFSAR
jgi:hypothetical protein